jgi:fructose-1,6-bisphosphatase/inositol monophosphatase family enzyme
MKNWQVEPLLELLAEAGRIALRHYEDPTVEIKPDLSVVTAADRAIENHLAGGFDRPEDGIYLIGEETLAKRSEAYIQKALAGVAYVVDPIDGTAPYTAHLPVWGVSIGRMERGVLTEGAIYLPVDDEAVFTAGGRVFRCRNLQSGNRTVEPFAFRRAANDVSGHIAIAQRCAKEAAIDLDHQVFAWSACVGTFYAMIKGRLLAYFAHFKLWDCAGCLPILRLGGYAGFFADGSEISADVVRGGSFILDAGSPRRWELRDFGVFAPDRATAEFIFQHIRKPEFDR